MLSFESAPNPGYFLGPDDGRLFVLTFPIEPDFHDELNLLKNYLSELDRSHPSISADKLVRPIEDRICSLIGDYAMCKSIEYSLHGPDTLETWEHGPYTGLPFSLEYFLDSVFVPVLAIYDFESDEDQLVIEDRMLMQLLSVMDRLCRNVLRHQLRNPLQVITQQMQYTVDDVRFTVENGRYATFAFSTFVKASH